MAAHTTPAERLKWVRRYRRGGISATAICQEAEISRSSFYRWLKRFDPEHPQISLRRPRQPRPARRTKATPEAFIALGEWKYRYPDWGKRRIYAHIQRVTPVVVLHELTGDKIDRRDYAPGGDYSSFDLDLIKALVRLGPSEATIGRMLSLIWQKCPVCGRRGGKHRPGPHGYGVLQRIAEVEERLAKRTVTPISP